MSKYQDIIENIHQKTIIVDAHLDLLSDLYKKHSSGTYNVIVNSYLKEFHSSGVDVIIAALFIDSRDLPEAATRQALAQVGAFYRELECAQQYINLCRNYREIQQTLFEGKIAVLLSFEGAEPLGDNPDLLKVFYELGFRGFGLCWSRKNLAADGSLYTQLEQGQKAGLSNLGYRLVREAERLGMIIDVSHLGDEGFEDIKKITRNPFIASHSNCRVLHSTERNLSDEQIIEIGRRGGVIGVNSCSALIAPNVEKATLKTLIAHIQHLIDLAGIEHVGLGFDFTTYMNTEKKVMKVGDNKIPVFDIVKGYAGINELTVELLKQGFTEKEIALLYGGNLMRLFSEILI